MENHQRQIGQILIEQKIITQKHLDHALFVQHYNGKRVGEILVELGYISQRQLHDALTLQSKESFQQPGSLTAKDNICKSMD